MDLKHARPLAERIVELLAPGCERIEIAGSVRRNKAEVKDIEIVCVPKPRKPQFGDKKIYATELDVVLENLSPVKAIDLVPIKGGPKYKQFSVRDQWVNLDLFIVTPPAQWGVLFTIRTGPLEFSEWVVTQRFKGGPLPSNVYVKGGAAWRKDGTADPVMIETPEEQDFLDLCGLGWIEPSQRWPRRLAANHFAGKESEHGISLFS